MGVAVNTQLQQRYPVSEIQKLLLPDYFGTADLTVFGEKWFKLAYTILMGETDDEMKKFAMSNHLAFSNRMSKEAYATLIFTASEWVKLHIKTTIDLSGNFIITNQIIAVFFTLF